MPSLGSHEACRAMRDFAATRTDDARSSAHVWRAEAGIADKVKVR